MPDSPTPSQEFIFVNRYFDPDLSATSQMLTDLARGLVARGLPVRVVCSRQLYTDAKAFLPPRETISGVRVCRVRTTRFGRTRLFGRAFDYATFYCSAAVALLRFVRSGDVIVAKTDPPMISVIAALVARLKGASLINWHQDVFPEVAAILGVSPMPRWLHSSLQSLRDASLRSARMNVLIGSRMHDYFQGRGIRAAQLCIIENWADADQIKPKPACSSALRARLELKDHFIVCYSGNLGRAHDFDTLLAAAEILRHDSSIAFLIIGGGAKMESLRNAAADLSLSSFRFLPYQDRGELADSLAAADVHIASLLPALEGLILPSKLYGILAAGRPLLFVGDVDGDIASIIDAAACGVSVELNASAELAAAIRMLQSDRASCTLMGKRAYAEFLREHTLDMAIDKWISVLRPMQQRGNITA
jgi:colanic acid biosynthesis glycosyl transferase WcaI